MHLVVNGFSQSVADGTSLPDLLVHEGIPPNHAIVEVNRTFVPPAALNTFVLRDGDVVELILPAFGG